MLDKMVHSYNMLQYLDKLKIELILEEIQGLDELGIKKRYRELRQSTPQL